MKEKKKKKRGINFVENDERVHLQRCIICQYLMSLSTDLDSGIPMKKTRVPRSDNETKMLLNLSLRNK